MGMEEERRGRGLLGARVRVRRHAYPGAFNSFTIFFFKELSHVKGG